MKYFYLFLLSLIPSIIILTFIYLTDKEKEEIVINRITGDPKVDDLIEPNWLIKKFTVLNEIDKEMARRDTYQGIKIDK